jgi:hypothetical protein
MSSHLNRRGFLVASSAAVLAVAARGHAARGRLAAVGGGRIQEPLEATVASPSDFMFAADEQGGTFLCSMYGPETGGFLGCSLMTVQGVVTPGSIQIKRGLVTFAGKVDVFLFPNVLVTPPEPFSNTAAHDFTVIARLGGPGKASMILKIPDVTAAIGGDTGGILRYGRIMRSRAR